MSEHRFTPGPWQVYVSDPPFGRTIHIGQADDATFTPHASDVAYQTVGCDPTSVQMANARLIAAAPELLEALEAIVEEYAGISDMWSLRAHAAIAKATGSAS